MAHTYYARLREVPLLAGCWQRHRTLTPLRTMQSRPPPLPRSGSRCPAQRPSSIDSDCPLGYRS
jgi:hypothetical protein